MARKMLGMILKEARKIHEGMVQECLAAQRKDGRKIGQHLVEKGYVSEFDVVEALAQQSGLEAFDLDPSSLPAELAERVPAATCEGFQVVPVADEGGVLTIAIADAGAMGMLDELQFVSGASEIRPVLASATAVKEAIGLLYQAETAGGGGGPGGGGGGGGITVASREGVLAIDAEGGGAGAAPVVKLLNLILGQAIRDKASDIHLEPFEEDFKVRYRVDGVLYEMKAPSRELAGSLVSRIKVLANLDISETRLPQDGRILTEVGGRGVDLRISTLPTMFGESCVIRVLDRSVVSLDLDNLGLRQRDRRLIGDLIGLPNGIILVTGPTGSGKTTTLYSALNTANEPGRKIITTEDPVEYDLDGIVQIQINEEIELTYARCLRSILRQDPDMILVGEIRDQDTAQIAVEASLTGHVVFSTLHTNDAPSAITRMVDIGVERFLIAATLEAIVAQRLVRRICSECREFYTPDEGILAELGLKPQDVAGKQFARGTGCEACHRLGFNGRMAIFEIMVMNEDLRQMVMDEASTEQIRTAAQRQGMQTLRDAGMLAIYDGLSTAEEVLRETSVV
ncbi:MAG: GspE/PulE family protein [Planctomycetota bacterium]|jgi:type IV pilus assembly protein PilB